METSRRNFLKAGCALIACSSVYAASKGSIQTLPEGAKKYALIHDETKCIGCNACTQACREINQVPEGVARLEIKRIGPVGEYPNQSFRFVRESCQHCEDAPCVRVCPTGAAYIDRDTGVVAVDSWKCVGCQYCIAACPYQVRFINPVTRSADKCDFCFESRLKQGELPACVEACPTQALVFGDLKDPQSHLVKLLKSRPSYRAKVELGTKPKLFRIASKNGEIKL